MTYHQKREKQLRIERSRRDAKLVRAIEAPGGERVLAFPRNLPFQVHWQYLYGALPLQDNPCGSDIRPRCANGFRLKDLGTIRRLAIIAGTNMEDLQRRYAARAY